MLKESLPWAAPLNLYFEASTTPLQLQASRSRVGERPPHLPLPGKWRHLGPARLEPGELSGCTEQSWRLSISGMDMLPLGEGRAVSPQSRVTQGNLSRKKPLPLRAALGQPRSSAAPSRVPAPRGSACPRPPQLASAVPKGPARQPRAGLIAEVDATPHPCC